MFILLYLMAAVRFPLTYAGAKVQVSVLNTALPASWRVPTTVLPALVVGVVVAFPVIAVVIVAKMRQREEIPVLAVSTRSLSY